MHPILIAGAVLVGLPILLHLIMKQEPKRLLFPAVRFVKLKQRINQRKMRLRHILLLLLRALIIALFCAALFQPRVPSPGSITLGGQPVAAVFLIDTSPSMGYTTPDGKTRLAEARRRAIELLDELPAGSKVAVLDPVDPLGTWEPSLGDARRKIEGFKEPHGGGPPLTTALATAYQLLKTVDQESDGETLPRAVVVFGDRTANCWQADRADDLKALREQIPPPVVNHLFIDVGADQPANVGIIGVEPRPLVAPSGQSVTIAVTVQATGPDVPTVVVRCKLDNAGNPEKVEVPLPAGTPKEVKFQFPNLPPGMHQAEVSLEAPDAMAFDNVRYVTFRVGATKRILTITDDPYGAVFWEIAHRNKGEFEVVLKKPDEVTDFAGFDGVCLFAVANPASGAKDGVPIWRKVRNYVDQGGKVLIAPGEQAVGYDPADEATAGVLPGKLDKVIVSEKGGEWAVPDKATHELLKDFRDWQLSERTDFLVNKRLAFKYWEVTGHDPAAVVVAYKEDGNDPAKRSPAVVERMFPAGGKVLLLTTRLDVDWPADQEQPSRSTWNNYWETAGSSWGVVLPHLLGKYLAGSVAEARFNYTTGQAVPVPLPKGDGQPKKFVLEGPGVAGPDAFPQIGERQAELRLMPAKTLTAGNYVLRTEDNSWREGFSLNSPAEESYLAKVPDEAIAAVFGPDRVVGLDKSRSLADVWDRDPELRLFPWLLIAVLVLFALEGLVANRFYRLRAQQQRG